jgi:hypothetical protein
MRVPTREAPDLCVSASLQALRFSYACHVCAVSSIAVLHTQACMQDVYKNGIRQTVHVLVTTYTEPAETVRECVIRCLVAPEPVYMEKHIYVCDDGHAKSEGPKKRAMVEELRVLGAMLRNCVPMFWKCCSRSIVLLQNARDRRLRFIWLPFRNSRPAWHLSMAD